MAKMIFVNLPVADLARSTAFYEAAGAVKNPRFSDATASCMVFSDSIHVMLLTHDKFMQFSPRPIADTKAACATLLCLSVDSRQDVDAIATGVAAAGGGPVSPDEDHGFMYSRNFQDPDGHVWEIMWMDVSAMPKAA